ncbi:MAG: serine hydrolase domain-containing protein [Candidatus Acidiferrum sp.]
MRAKFVLIGFLSAFLGSSAMAETASRHAFDLWLEAFNAADAAKLTAFWKVYNPAWTHVERELHVRKESGGFTLAKIISDDGTKLEAVVADAGETFLGITLKMKSVDPPAIEDISIHGAATSKDIVSRFANDTDLTAALRNKADSLAASDQFSGTVLLAHNGKILLNEAWGLADREHNKKATLDTQFRIGSMNKMFTAIAALQLVQQGKLSLDRSIADYWPDYPNQDLAKRVNLRDLLDNTGGTGDIFTNQYNEHRLEIRTLNDYVKLYGRRDVEFQPGSQFRYSNYGFLLLGALVEKVSGISYYEYVREYIFKPAGMTHTDSLPEAEDVPKRAVGYLPGKSGWEPNTDTLPWRGTPAGGGYSTVDDLFLFAQALNSGKLISPKLFEQATAEQFSGSHYGFGFQVDENYFGHSGAAPGINGELRIYPEPRYVIVVLSNLEPPAAMRLAAFGGHRLPL